MIRLVDPNTFEPVIRHRLVEVGLSPSDAREPELRPKAEVKEWLVNTLGGRYVLGSGNDTIYFEFESEAHRNWFVLRWG